MEKIDDQGDIGVRKSVNLETVRNSDVPVVAHGVNARVIILNKEVYLGTEESPTTPEERENYKDVLEQAITKGIEDSPLLAPEKKEEMIAYVEKTDGTALFIEKMQNGDFGTNQVMSLFDNQTFLMHYSGESGGLLKYVEGGSLPANVREVADVFIFHHEMGHRVYDFAGEKPLSEPAADYIGAVQTLIEVPDSRAALGIIADFRTMEGGVERFLSVDNHSNATETLCGRAIREAMALGQYKLDELSAMPDEERRYAVWELAYKYEARLESHEKLACEDEVKDYLEEIEQQRDVTFKTPSQETCSILKELLENSPFDPHSEAYRVLQDISSSSERIYLQNSDFDKVLLSEPDSPNSEQQLLQS